MVASPEWTAGWTPHSGRLVGNSPKFMPLDNSLNRDILHYFHMHSVLSHDIVVEEFSFSTHLYPLLERYGFFAFLWSLKEEGGFPGRS